MLGEHSNKRRYLLRRCSVEVYRVDMGLVILGVLACLLPVRIVDSVGDVDIFFLRLKGRSLVRQVGKLHRRWLICVII